MGVLPVCSIVDGSVCTPHIAVAVGSYLCAGDVGVVCVGVRRSVVGLGRAPWLCCRGPRAGGGCLLGTTWGITNDLALSERQRERERLGRFCPISQIIILGLAMLVRSPSLGVGGGEGKTSPQASNSLDEAEQEVWAVGRKQRGLSLPAPARLLPQLQVQMRTRRPKEGKGWPREAKHKISFLLLRTLSFLPCLSHMVRTHTPGESCSLCMWPWPFSSP